jgi:hypothetical protein
MGRIDLALYDQPVTCDPVTEVCSMDGHTMEALPLRSWAFMSTETTRFAPDGFYLYSELARAGGVEAELEIDVPLYEDPSESTALYRERTNGEITFEATSAAGGVQLARDLSGASCECADGRLELVFVDPGPDEIPETSDDLTRHLSRARFSWDSSPCVHPRVLAIGESGLDVSRIDNCPAGPRPSTPPPAPDPDPWPDPTRDPTWDDASCDASCGSSSSSSSSSGCDDSGSCDSSGCEGDTSDSSGCEGDSGGSCADDPACEAESTASIDRGVRCGRRGFRTGPLQTFALTGLVLFWIRKRVR